MSKEIFYRRWQVLQLALAKPENYNGIGIRTQKLQSQSLLRYHFAIPLYNGDVYRPL